MEFSGKIRAGRAYLEWTQEQLAAFSDLSVQAIQKIERGESSPTTRTRNKIIRAFDKHGITFTDKGVEYTENPIFFVEGTTHENTYLQLLEDVLEHLEGVKEPELLIMYADDRVSPPSVNNLYRKMIKSGIKIRQLVEDGNSYLLGALEDYRYVPKQYFINRVTLVYGDRTASTTSDILKACIKVDAIDAGIQRNTFNILWSVLEQPEESTADERF